MWQIQKKCKKKTPENMKNDRNPATWVLIWESLARAIQWIPTWQDLDVFLKYFYPCALDVHNLSFGRNNLLIFAKYFSQKHTSICDNIWKRNVHQIITNNSPSSILSNHPLYCEEYQRYWQWIQELLSSFTGLKAWYESWGEGLLYESMPEKK